MGAAAGECLPNFNFVAGPGDVFGARGQVWALAEGIEWNKKPGTGHLLGLDLKTGQVNRRFSTKEAFDVGHHHRCYRNKATERFLLASRRGVEFLELASGENQIGRAHV